MARTFRELMDEVCPPWLLTTHGRPFMRALGQAKDALRYRASQALRIRFPRYMTDDALSILGDERGLPRAAGETREQYAERLRKAWDIWQYAGTARGMLTALVAAGYDNVHLVIKNQRRYTMNADYEMTMAELPSGSWKFRSVGTPFWNDFAVLFPNPLPQSWQDNGVPSGGSDEALLIKKLVRTWKPAHMRLAGIAIAPVEGGAEELWDYFDWPTVGTWNDGQTLGHVLDDSTFSLHRLNEASGNALDAGTRALHLTAFNGPGAGTGQIGGARVLGATNQYFLRNVSITDVKSLFLTTGLTLECWVNLGGTTPSALRSFFGFSGNYGFFQISNARIPRVTVGTQSTPAPGAIAATGFHHLCARIPGGATGVARAIRLNVDGALVNTNTVTPTLSGGSSDLFIGLNGGSHPGALVDDARVSIGERSDAEVLQSYHRGLGAWDSFNDWTYWSV